MTTLLTLTLDPKKLRGENSTRYINEVFAHFRVYLRRRFGCAPQYIRALEYQKNRNAHFHILLNRFVPQAWVSQAWASLGGGSIVDIRRVDLHRISHYLSKYLTKEMLLHAPKRAPRHLLQGSPSLRKAATDTRVGDRSRSDTPPLRRSPGCGDEC